MAGIVCALSAEARHLGPRTGAGARIEALADGTLLSVSGIGAVAARRGAQALVEAGASALVSFGLAGGLDPSLPAGAICLPSEVIATSGIVMPTARLWRERIGAALAGQRTIAAGRLLSSERAVASVEDKAQLFRATGAVAVDMESAAVAQVASAHGLPFVAARVIVDSAADELPRAVAVAADGAGRLKLWRLIGALALAPADLPPLFRLARRYRAASRSLAALARSGVRAPHASP